MKYINYKKINIYVCIYMYIYIYIYYILLILYFYPPSPLVTCIMVIKLNHYIQYS